MNTIVDNNCARNKGCAICVNPDKLFISNLEDISNVSNEIDSAWGLIMTKSKRYIFGTVYLKLRYNEAINAIMTMLELAKTKLKVLNASGIILVGDLNSRHMSWGDSTNNDYSKELLQKLDPTQFSVVTSKDPTFLCVGGSSYIDLMIISNNIADNFISCTSDNYVELYSGAP